jgi:methylphosphotriester-DNA--protein-cysteine methyltransferase
MYICDYTSDFSTPTALRGPSLAQRISDLIDHPDTESVEQICLALDISHARLVRICRREFGHTPKTLMRRARFMGMLTELRIRPYTQWRFFLDPRYVDQSHFIRDFQYFLGMAPTRYLALPKEMQAILADGLLREPELALAA